MRFRWLAPAVFGLALLSGCGAPKTSVAVFQPGIEVADEAYDLTPAAQAAGVGTQNFAKVNAGFYRGGLPADKDLKALVKLGIKTDISFLGRAPGDSAMNAKESKAAEAVGLKWINCAVPFNSDPTSDFVTNFLSLVENPANQPVYVHCLHGRDRTGMMVALYRIQHDHLTNQQALDEMKSFGFKPKDYPRFERFVLGFDPADFAVAP